jgi:anhydro-N-acetylmuramic acid kinase
MNREGLMSAPHEQLQILADKPHRLVAGIMSGTSVDGIDVALVRIHGSGRDTKAELQHYYEMPIADEVRELILNNTEVSTSTISEICVLECLIAKLYSQAVHECCLQANIDLQTVDLIAMHGQTMFHIPDPVEVAGYSISSSYQCGSAPVIAADLGIPVISDFRSADMARGGQGAPLVPYVDYLLYHSVEQHRALVNIGGIANITWLPAGCLEDQILAYDSGPGNMVVNSLMRYFYNADYDIDGEVARKGILNQDLFGWMVSQPYFRKDPPKSTGRELFGQKFLEPLLEIANDFGINNPEDIIATAAQLTVWSISNEIKKITAGQLPIEVYICGGGSKNKFFIDGLRHNFGPGVVFDCSKLGINPDAKEAFCFAVLANEWLFGNRANVPTATGALTKALLGCLSLP